jgi:arsenate reductase
MIKIMFVCTGNSCRSQMAEGFARELGKGKRSKEIDERILRSMDVVVTLCDNAAESCPWTPPHIQVLHWPIRDPVGTRGSEDKIMGEFRRARDEIRKKIDVFLEDLNRENQ